ncbi:HAMP domain-containing sensor histidine kinase [Nonomuraea sp. NPDC000554]|uniref:sensor histidine kinase n=1 Tax=Nonomuraea sp. NPDC000554 TaxID=3154259 RepID=UPI003316ACE9
MSVMCLRDAMPVHVDGTKSTSFAPSGEEESACSAQAVNRTPEQAENARRRMDRMLAQQRQFVSDASHELRTPIAGLRTQLEEAQLHPDTTDLDELLSCALRDVDRLQAIVSDLFALARVGMHMPDERVRVDLSELVDAEISRRADELPVLVRLAPGATVDVVDHEIQRLVANLLDNAQRHGKHVLHVEVHRNGDYAELVVADDGNGIAVADREWVFQRFSRLDTARSRCRGGTGLGLAIVRDTAEAHGGTVEVGESACGGARFVVRLPLADSPPSP